VLISLIFFWGFLKMIFHKCKIDVMKWFRDLMGYYRYKITGLTFEYRQYFESMGFYWDNRDQCWFGERKIYVPQRCKITRDYEGMNE